jgi:hypothetical protein
LEVKLLDTLMLADLKRLAKSKSIPNVIATAAHRLAIRKAQK